MSVTGKEANETTTAKKAPAKRKLPETRLLFGTLDSKLFFVSITYQDETQDHYKVNRVKDYAVKMTADSVIEGLPASAGGCSVTISPSMAADLGLPYEKLVDLIEKANGYGRRFAFLDDRAASKPILDQMRRQAAKEARVNNEAMTEGIARSDMAVY